MSDAPKCPYCGESVAHDVHGNYDDKVNVKCQNCGGVFEYIPGFGTFSVPEDFHSDTQKRSTPAQQQRPPPVEQQKQVFESSGPSTGPELWEPRGPRFEDKKSKEEFDTGSACMKICALFCVQCVLFLLLVVAMTGFLFF
ncbi:MAG: hypothetical protein ACXAEB_12855 [Candidatus Thorarchaeota archaeon]|jgi:hypothetical protein